MRPIGFITDDGRCYAVICQGGDTSRRASRSLIVVRNRYGFRSVLQRLPRLAQMIALEPLAKLLRRVLWGRHTAVTDHGFGKPYGGRGVDVLAVDGVAMARHSPEASCATPGSTAG